MVKDSLRAIPFSRRYDEPQRLLLARLSSPYRFAQIVRAIGRRRARRATSMSYLMSCLPAPRRVDTCRVVRRRCQISHQSHLSTNECLRDFPLAGPMWPPT
jgi:hypothetical protein